MTMDKILSYVTRQENILISVAYKNYEQDREDQGSREKSESRTVRHTLVTREIYRRGTYRGTENSQP